MSKALVIYESFLEAIRTLDIPDQLGIWDCVLDYGINEIEPNMKALNGSQKVIWILIKPQLDATQKRWKKANNQGVNGVKGKDHGIKGKDHGIKGQKYGILGKDHGDKGGRPPTKITPPPLSKVKLSKVKLNEIKKKEDKEKISPPIFLNNELYSEIVNQTQFKTTLKNNLINATSGPLFFKRFWKYQVSVEKEYKRTRDILPHFINWMGKTSPTLTKEENEEVTIRDQVEKGIIDPKHLEKYNELI